LVVVAVGVALAVVVGSLLEEAALEEAAQLIGIRALLIFHYLVL
jgi:hypothetical protein